MRDHDNRTVEAGDSYLSLDFERLVATRRQAAPAPPSAQSRKIPAMVYAVMAITTLLTFSTLTTCYELFFRHQLFA